MQKEKIEHIAHSMGITRDELESRKAYFGLDQHQLVWLKKINEVIGQLPDEFLRSFYANLMSFNETRQLLSDKLVLEKLRTEQAAYFDELVSGQYDWNYACKRLWLGVVHQKKGVNEKWFLGAYASYLSGMLEKLGAQSNISSEDQFAMAAALIRAVLFDVSLALESYFYADAESLKKLKQFSEHVIDVMPIGIAIVNSNKVIEKANNAICDMFGVDEIKRGVFGINELMLDCVTEREIDLALSMGEYKQSICKHIDINEKRRRLKISLSPTRINNENMVLVMIEDVTQQEELTEQLKELSRVVEQTADAVTVTDASGVITYVNPAFEKTTGYQFSEVIGKKPGILRSGKHDQDFYINLWNTLKRGEVFGDIFINRRKDGSLYYEEKTITPMVDESGKIVHFVSTGKDVSDRIQTQERFYYLANHDALTDLPNRMLLMERAKQAISRSRWDDRLVVLFFIDVDRFKNVNDTLGHDVGDYLLKEISVRLIGCVREGDTVARLGGDEFAILLRDVAVLEDVIPVASEILQTITRPIHIAGREIIVSASIGISCCPLNGNDPKELLRNADIAMYRAKETGKNRFQFYSNDMTTKVSRRLNMETSLRRALEKNEFRLVYQPQINIGKKYVVGAEALLRWDNGENGLVSPADFVPILEDTGLINQVGRWVIAEACDELKRIRKNGARLDSISVNLSARQIVETGLVSFIEYCLGQSGMSPDSLIIEITESLLMENHQQSVGFLRDLRNLGVRIALDDFGTGYSSLSYLTRFPINSVKIDRSFISDLHTNKQSLSITSAIISMAHDLDISVIAEGVETREQLEVLREKGCDEYQGYYFSRPIQPEEFHEKIKRYASEGSLLEFV
jgi:diguanylate cyclase (GGDEF)-like protein/PAS domain S-box-containing protein